MSKGGKERKVRRRWYQYRPWYLFVVVTVGAIGCSWYACRMAKAKRQKEAVAAIRHLGGYIVYDYQVPEKGYERPYDPPGPAWFRNVVGEEFLVDVVGASLDFSESVDAGLVTDADLECFKGLTTLEWLCIRHTQVTEEGVQRLQQALPNCKIYHESTQLRTNHDVDTDDLRRQSQQPFSPPDPIQPHF